MEQVSPPLRAPGPKGHWLLGNLRERNKDAVGFFYGCSKTYGDFFRLRLGTVPVFIVARPSLVKEVLVDRSDVFVRQHIFNELSTLLGRGLLTSQGPRWRKHRKLVQPAFHLQSLQGFFELMVRHTEIMIAQWRRRETRDLTDDFTKLTLRIVAESLLGYDTAKSEGQIVRIVTQILPQIFFRIGFLPFANSLPTKRNRDFKTNCRSLDRLMDSIIDGRRASGEERKDLLSMLMAAVDEDDGSKLTNAELRDEIMTMFLAGHETTANGLSWTLEVLADHPEVEDKMRAEIRRVVGDGPLQLKHLRELTYIKMVFEESIRLYPPAWAIPRTAKENTVLGGYAVPKGSVMSVNPFIMHRQESVFPDPLRFDPERFSPERRKDIDRYGYIPFGAGPHGCIGQQFAQMEAQVVLALLYQRFTFRKPPGLAPVVPQATITLRPEPGIIRTIAPAPLDH